MEGPSFHTLVLTNVLLAADHDLGKINESVALDANLWALQTGRRSAPEASRPRNKGKRNKKIYEKRARK